jgi:hypothetical protein
MNLKIPEKAVVLLDEYEEFVPSQPEQSLFIRALVPVIIKDKRICEAWTYLYNRPVEKII